jgi:hypothetical protein
VRCDETGGPSCGARYRCDPAAALAPIIPTLAGSSIPEDLSPTLQAQIGCVRKLCDEADGFTCRTGWTCDPESAPNEASGCVPEPCETGGQCQSNYYICDPMNDGPRPPEKDLHGCVARNCGEGNMCQAVQQNVNYAYCDLASDAADAYGCVTRRCDEVPEVCLAGYTCDLGSNAKNAFGCRLLDCSEPGGRACLTGMSCLPVPGSTAYACSSNPGTGGSGGMSSTGGSPSGGPRNDGTAGLANGGVSNGGISNGGAVNPGGLVGSGGGSAAGAPKETGGASASGSNGVAPGAVGTCVDKE